MSTRKKSTKTRLIEAALELFTEKGVTDTTTKAVADRAQVNEVTLFRHFGSKHGLLLAVTEHLRLFSHLKQTLLAQGDSQPNIAQILQDYGQNSLEALEKVPELVHSVIGEAGQYPPENRLALGQRLTEANQHIAKHLASAIAQEGLEVRFPPETLTSLVNGLILGYFTINSTIETEGDGLWLKREDFLASLVELFLHGAIITSRETEIILETQSSSVNQKQIQDLPASLVRSLFRQAKKQGRQEYALVYVLFGAGLSSQEVVNLERSHFIRESGQRILQINQGAIRQVPLNQWILGKRYGFAESDPVIQWLKSRKDEQSALFLNEEKQPISQQELASLWQTINTGLLTPQAQPPTLKQAQQTWCVEMLSKGIDLENLSILSGMEIAQLQPFAQRAREKAAIEAAYHLDKQNKK
ncbi:MAG: TetR/AcrR family transcriptional regulator [Spirulinaceae cyanobacterium]